MPTLKQICERQIEEFWKTSKGEIPEDTADDLLRHLQSCQQELLKEITTKIKELEIYTPDDIKTTTYNGEYHFIDSDKLNYILNNAN